MGGSGGGSAGSGKVSYPEYIQSTHARMLYGLDEEDYDSMGTWDFNIMDDIEAAHYNNPWEGGFFYDPSTELGELGTVVGELSTIADAFTPASDWESYVDRAITKINSDILSDDSYVDTEVEAYDEDTKDEFLRAMARFKAGYADINAVNSSAFVLGLMGLEKQRLRDIDRYRAQMKLQDHQRRIQVILAAVQSITQHYNLEMEFKLKESQMVLEDSKLSIAANQEYLEAELNIAASAAVWDLETWQYGTNVLAAASGGTTVSGPQSKGKSASQRIAGAVGGGASLGLAAAALPFGPPGWAIGAAIGAGALAGGLS